MIRHLGTTKRRRRPVIRRRIMPAAHPLVRSAGRRYTAMIVLVVLWAYADAEDYAVLRAATDGLLRAPDPGRALRRASASVPRKSSR